MEYLFYKQAKTVVPVFVLGWENAWTDCANGRTCEHHSKCITGNKNWIQKFIPEIQDCLVRRFNFPYLELQTTVF